MPATRVAHEAAHALGVVRKLFILALQFTLLVIFVLLEAKHGASLAGYITVTFGQAPALSPPFIQRALASGIRYNFETRGTLFYL